jgi:pimeloyl-ACP methyl ester carboxylesterase
MTSYLLIPGAGGVAWYWRAVAALLDEAGHEAIPVDLPGDDEQAGLLEYRDLVLAAMDGRRDAVLVAQSLGGFTAPMVCDRAPVRELVFVNAMVPAPGETPGEWWDHVGSEAARVAAAEANRYSTDLDLETYFLHDLTPEQIAEGEPHQRNEADIVFASTCDFTAWPDVPIRVLAGAEDRLFPAEFQRRVARERLGIETDVLPGGHLIAQSNPTAVARYLLTP